MSEVFNKFKHLKFINYLIVISIFACGHAFANDSLGQHGVLVSGLNNNNNIVYDESQILANGETIPNNSDAYALTKDNNGNVYIGTTAGGVWQCSPSCQKWTQVGSQALSGLIGADSKITYAITDKNNNLYVSVVTGMIETGMSGSIWECAGGGASCQWQEIANQSQLTESGVALWGVVTLNLDKGSNLHALVTDGLYSDYMQYNAQSKKWNGSNCGLYFDINNKHKQQHVSKLALISHSDANVYLATPNTGLVNPSNTEVITGMNNGTVVICKGLHRSWEFYGNNPLVSHNGSIFAMAYDTNNNVYAATASNPQNESSDGGYVKKYNTGNWNSIVTTPIGLGNSINLMSINSANSIYISDGINVWLFNDNTWVKDYNIPTGLLVSAIYAY